MKKILIPLNILSFAVIAFLLLSNKEKTSPVRQSNYPDSCKLCGDYTGPFNYLDTGMLREMTANYDTTLSTYQPLYTGTKNYPAIPYQRGSTFHSVHTTQNKFGLAVDARSVWFSLDSLKRFIWEIESNLCKKNCADIKNLGIRLYYARYPSISKYPQLARVKRGYENLHTIFMVPTYQDNNNANIDFDPRRPPNCTNNERFSNFLVFMPLTNGLAKNHGTLCPPECTGNGSAF